MKTLPDYIGNNLNLLSIGLNPSLASVAAGYYFAGRNNRFWPALNASGLPGVDLKPGPEACQYLYEKRGIGFTDVVKRPSRGASDLRAADYREWVPHLEQRISEFAPAMLWFHGKVAFSYYLRCRQQSDRNLEWGLQPVTQQGAKVYLSPNPSAANAVFSLEDLTSYYRELYELYCEIGG